MSDLSNALHNLAQVISSVAAAEGACTLQCLNEMMTSKSLIEVSAQLNEFARRDIEMSIAGTLVSPDCNGMGLQEWVPEFNAQQMTIEAARLERSLLCIREALLKRLEPEDQDILQALCY